jgi:hypothetical protein
MMAASSASLRSGSIIEGRQVSAVDCGMGSVARICCPYLVGRWSCEDGRQGGVWRGKITVQPAGGSGWVGGVPPRR